MTQARVPRGVRAHRRMALAAGALLALFACVAASPARAQWTRVVDLPSTDFYSLYVTGDTLVAGQDAFAWISTDGGGTWRRSAPVGPIPASVETVWFRNGRWWAGTIGQGVFTSDDLGLSWQARRDGLAGGLFDSHLYILDFEVRADSLYAATGGAGVFVRPLRTGGPWAPTGSQLVANQSGSVEDLSVNGTRLVAASGANGMVHRNDGGAPWVQMPLDNLGLLPGLQVTCVSWTGSAWLVGTDHGFYRSPDGNNPWTFAGLNVGQTSNSLIAAKGGRAYVCMNRTTGADFRWTADDGATWSALGTLPTYVYEIALAGPNLWAARSDGLWVRSVSNVGAPFPVPRAAAFTVRGPHPVAGGEARLAFGLDSDGRGRVEIFDVSGRRVRALDHAGRAGDNELTLDVRDLPGGVYHARLSVEGRVETLRFVRVRP